jgi:hypothetical protein
VPGSEQREGGQRREGNLRESDVIAAKLADDLRNALEQVEEILGGLGRASLDASS